MLGAAMRSGRIKQLPGQKPSQHTIVAYTGLNRLCKSGMGGMTSIPYGKGSQRLKVSEMSHCRGLVKNEMRQQ